MRCARMSRSPVRRLLFRIRVNSAAHRPVLQDPPLPVRTIEVMGIATAIMAHRHRLWDSMQRPSSHPLIPQQTARSSFALIRLPMVGRGSSLVFKSTRKASIAQALCIPHTAPIRRMSASYPPTPRDGQDQQCPRCGVASVDKSWRIINDLWKLPTNRRAPEACVSSEINLSPRPHRDLLPVCLHKISL